jgi:hypothetical protein
MTERKKRPRDFALRAKMIPGAGFLDGARRS